LIGVLHLIGAGLKTFDARTTKPIPCATLWLDSSDRSR